MVHQIYFKKLSTVTLKKKTKPSLPPFTSPHTNKGKFDQKQCVLKYIHKYKYNFPLISMEHNLSQGTQSLQTFTLSSSPSPRCCACSHDVCWGCKQAVADHDSTVTNGWTWQGHKRRTNTPEWAALQHHSGRHNEQSTSGLLIPHWSHPD